MAATRVQVVKWGNSKAVRLPKRILEQARVREGDELNISVEHDRITLERSEPAVTLKKLVLGITPQNIHRETGWGTPVGIEKW